jgi:hypothetical protein
MHDQRPIMKSGTTVLCPLSVTPESGNWALEPMFNAYNECHYDTSLCDLSAKKPAECARVGLDSPCTWSHVVRNSLMIRVQLHDRLVCGDPILRGYDFLR